MTVQAKFIVQEVQHQHVGGGNSQANIKLTPVIGDQESNESWSKWTPSGELQMCVTNPDAIKQFVVGRCYILTFEETEEQPEPKA